MIGDFERAVEIVLDLEGGYSDDPNDPGGRTIYGISKRAHPEAWKDGPPTLDEVKRIYKADYWDKVKGDELPWPLCLFVFDAAVNQGVDSAIRMLQRALQTVQDGIIGRQTLALAKNSGDWHAAQFMVYRVMRYQGTRNFDRFGVGWLTRLFLVAMEAV